MKSAYNIYCDESCHLENDRQPVMLQGAMRCPREISGEFATAIRALKKQHRAEGELKWTKVSASRRNFYLELLEWFFSTPGADFRALVVQNKQKLNHEAFNEGSHDTFYYKMYFSLLSKMLSPDCTYNIYLDIKDTRSRVKLRHLKEVLCHNVFDFTSQMIGHIQNIHSGEAELMQLADFLIGAVAYRHRHLDSNPVKREIVAAIEKHIGRSLLLSSPLAEGKFNVFVFTPQDPRV